MINAIGEATMQQFVRTSYAAEVSNIDLEVRKTDKVRAQRPVEESEDGKKPDMNLKSRNSLEDGQVIVEKYTEDGKLVKKIPPGFLPFSEMV